MTDSPKDRLRHHLADLRSRPQSIEATDARFGRLVDLTPRRPGLSTVVVVHPVGGSLFCYRQLAEQIATVCNVVGFEASEVTGPPPSFTDRAADYVRLLQHESIEPALVGGWSVGGLIAREMIANLSAVPAVLIDSTWPEPPMQQPSPRELREWFMTDLRGAATPQSDDTDTFQHYLQIFESNCHPFLTHVPTSLDARATLISGWDTDPDMWRRFEGARLQFVAAPFGHYELLRAPDAVEIVANTFTRVLQEES